jgi:hypothetical protein
LSCEGDRGRSRPGADGRPCAGRTTAIPVALRGASASSLIRLPPQHPPFRLGRQAAWDQVQRSPGRLPRALRTLAHEAVVTEDGPHPPVEVEPTAPRCARVALAARATSVPFTAVLNGPERITTDNGYAALNSAISCLRRSRFWPIWLWEQGVAGSNPAVPTTSTTPCSPGVPTAPHSANRSTLPVASRSTTP